MELVTRLSWGQEDSGVIIDMTIGSTRCVVSTTSGESRAHTAGEASRLLSPREREIARMVANGYTNKAIAKVLEISSWTVSTHLRRVFGKLDVGSRAAMVARLLETPPTTVDPSTMPARHQSIGG
ncbi:MAG: response regulator transcription factor [Candidatus Limnocylindria bacterium]